MRCRMSSIGEHSTSPPSSLHVSPAPRYQSSVFVCVCSLGSAHRPCKISLASVWTNSSYYSYVVRDSRSYISPRCTLTRTVGLFRTGALARPTADFPVPVVPEQEEKWDVSRERAPFNRAELSEACEALAVGEIRGAVDAGVFVWRTHACPAVGTWLVAR